MKIQGWVEKTVESSRARIVTLFLFAALIGGFTFLALRARANLAPAPDFQTTLAQQTKEIDTAGSLNDFFDKGWLANDRNFSELAGYVGKLAQFAASPSLDPKFKQELGDYVLKNRSRLPKESSQIAELSFSDGILRQAQASLLDMYDQLSLVFQTLQDVVSYWDQDAPQERRAKLLTIQDSFSTASVEFQVTTSSHRKILNYARLLDAQSKQASATELDRIRTRHTQFALSISGLIASVLLFAGWVIFLARHRRRKMEVLRQTAQKDRGG